MKLINQHLKFSVNTASSKKQEVIALSSPALSKQVKNKLDKNVKKMLTKLLKFEISDFSKQIWKLLGKDSH